MDTICEGHCGEEVPLDETSQCSICGLDPLCASCIVEFDHECKRAITIPEEG